ncbi:MAG TPA: hypothetical protein VHG30_06595 [Microvirga sp.]|nr:hypothetical protein [Microvirga sp.]
MEVGQGSVPEPEHRDGLPVRKRDIAVETGQPSGDSPLGMIAFLAGAAILTLLWTLLLGWLLGGVFGLW